MRPGPDLLTECGETTNNGKGYTTDLNTVERIVDVGITDTLLANQA